jgi:hypothetical protein
MLESWILQTMPSATLYKLHTEDGYGWAGFVPLNMYTPVSTVAAAAKQDAIYQATYFHGPGFSVH